MTTQQIRHGDDVLIRLRPGKAPQAGYDAFTAPSTSLGINLVYAGTVTGLGLWGDKAAVELDRTTVILVEDIAIATTAEACS